MIPLRLAVRIQNHENTTENWGMTELRCADYTSLLDHGFTTRPSERERELQIKEDVDKNGTSPVLDSDVGIMPARPVRCANLRSSG